MENTLAQIITDLMQATEARVRLAKQVEELMAERDKWKAQALGAVNDAARDERQGHAGDSPA